MVVTRSQKRELEKSTETTSSSNFVVKNDMSITPSQQCEHKTASETTPSSEDVKRSEVKRKAAVIKKIRKRWGRHFVRCYIPLLQRPRRHDVSSNRPEEQLYEDTVTKWPLSVLKAILVIAKLTSQQQWVRNAINDVVDYRIRNTVDRTSCLTAADCEMIRNMLVNKWDVEHAFKMNTPFGHREQDKSNDETRPAFDASQGFNDDNDVDIKKEEAKPDRNKKRSHDSGPSARQHGVAAASSKAQPEGRDTQKPTSETSSSVSYGENQKKRKRSAVNDALLEAISVPINRKDSTRDHTSAHSHAKHPSYDSCSSSYSSSSSISYPSPPARSSTTKLGSRKISCYGMFPPPPSPRATTPLVQIKSEAKNHSDNTPVRSKQNTIDLTISPPDHRKDDANTHFENNGHKNDDDEVEDDEDDEDDDQQIFNAKLAAAEAELNLARLRVAAARKAKKARTSVSSRGNSTSSS